MLGFVVWKAIFVVNEFVVNDLTVECTSDLDLGLPPDLHFKSDVVTY